MNNNCKHLHWRNMTCPECGKKLTLDEAFSATLRHLDYILGQATKPEDIQELEVCEASLKQLGDGYTDF